MNWVPFLVAAWLLLGMDLGAADLLQVRFGSVVLQPSLVMPLAVFVAAGAPAAQGAWACLLLGLLVDFTRPLPTRSAAGLVVLGPNALGYLVGSQLVLSLRSVVIRRNPLTIGVLTVLASVVASLVVVAAFTIRSMFESEIVWGTWYELGSRMGSSVYTGLVGVVLGWALIRLSPAFGFNLGQRHMPTRSYERR